MSRTPRPGFTRPFASPLPALSVAICALALAGCSDGRLPAPSLTTTARPSTLRTLSYPQDGVALRAPANWSVTAESSPLVTVISSGPATIALWRYATTASAPTGAGLAAALRRLERAAQARDPSMRIQATAVTTLGRAGAVIIDAIEEINGQRRRVRTEHVYLNGAELVLEAYAPPAQFAADDHLVFSPVRKSLRLLNGGRPTSTTVPGA